jgi:hypothetical protein
MPTINEVWERALLVNPNLGTLHNDQVDAPVRGENLRFALAEASGSASAAGCRAL